MITSSFLTALTSAVFPPAGKIYVGYDGTPINALGSNTISSVVSQAGGVIESLGNTYFTEAATSTSINCLCVGQSAGSIYYTLPFSTTTLEPGQLIKVNQYNGAGRGFRVEFSGANE